PSNSDIFGQRVTTGGGLSGAEIAISTAANDQTRPSIAFQAGHWFVVWRDTRNSVGAQGDIFGTRLDTTGTVETFAQLSADPTEEERPAVAAGPLGRSLVAYQRFIIGPPFEAQRVRARTVTYTDGTACTLNSQCSTGFCRDGVCCNSDCGGG